MTTVARRTFSSTPERDANQTWNAIVDLLTQGRTGTARSELLAVGGAAASVIADQAPKYAPIVVTCDGPRTRIYCIYDDDAIGGANASEDPLGFEPLTGNWHISLPCLADDLEWIRGALKRHSDRITARDLDASASSDCKVSSEKGEPLVIDPKGFFGS